MANIEKRMNNKIIPAILSCSGYHLTDDEKYFFSKHPPLGINLFSRNIQNKQQLQNLIKEIKNVIPQDNVLIAIDQEGGRVRRLREPDFRSYAAAIDIGNLPLKEAALTASLQAELISDDLHQCGINVNYAPVLDIIHKDTTLALKSRCYGSDAQKNATIGKNIVDTYIQNGIIPCIKHMPGHGRATIDPHLNLPRISCSLQELEQDMSPFKHLSYAPLGMTAHIIIEAIDENYPITQSTTGIDLLIRKTIGFDGLLVSDAIDMYALKGNIGEKTKSSLSAGCDAICYALGKMDDMQQIVDNCQYMSDKSLERFAKSIKILQNKHNIKDVKNLELQYNSLIGKIIPYQEEYDATEVLNRLSLIN